MVWSGEPHCAHRVAEVPAAAGRAARTAPPITSPASSTPRLATTRTGKVAAAARRRLRVTAIGLDWSPIQRCRLGVANRAVADQPVPAARVRA